MWNIFDQWIVILALGWSSWVIYRSLTKKSFLSCNRPCEKKIFKNKSELIGLNRKDRSLN